MSNPLTATGADSHRARHSFLARATWLREPLLHFILLGGVLFAADHFLNSREDDSRVIVVDDVVDGDARRLFSAARGRAPDAKELTALRQVWLDNEVLYREGLALGVDRGDSAIRERVIFKALSMVEAGIVLPTIDDAKLRAWFETNRAKYDEPARFSFQEAVISGDSSESAVRAFAATLNGGTPGDVNAGLRVFKERPLSNLEQSYGAEFAQQLGSAAAGEWRAIKSKDGWRAVMLESRSEAKPATYEVMRGVALQDWKDETAAALRTQAVRALARKYQVHIAADAK